MGLDVLLRRGDWTVNQRRGQRFRHTLEVEEGMVGASGFEPPTSWSRTRFQPLLWRVARWCVEVFGAVSFA